MIKRFIKKNIFLIIIFAAISFFCSSFIYLIENGIKTSSAENNFLSVDSVNFSIDSNQKDNLKNHLTEVNGDYTLLRRDRAAYKNEVLGVFIRGKLKKTPPILQGRFFSENDFDKDNNFIVIGKNLKSNIIKKDNIDYYYIKNNYYKVIGILGNSKKQSYYDDKIYLNLNYMLAKNNSFIKGDYTVDAALNSENIYSSIKKAYAKDNVAAAKTPPSYVSSVSQTINSFYKFDIENMIKMLIPIIINIFLITTYWIKKRAKEIAIKRAFGATRLKVSSSIMVELVLVSVLSFIMGYLLYLLISYLKDGYLHFYIETVLYVFIITVISGIISSAVPIIKACLVQPAEMMR